MLILYLPTDRIGGAARGLAVRVIHCFGTVAPPPAFFIATPEPLPILGRFGEGTALETASDRPPCPFPMKRVQSATEVRNPASETMNNKRYKIRLRHIKTTAFLALLLCVTPPFLSGCHTTQLVSAGQPIVSRSPTGIEVDLSVTNMCSRPLFVAARLEAKGPAEQWSGKAGRHTRGATRAVALRSPGTNATFNITLDGDFSVCRVRLACREGGGWRERTYMKSFSQERVLTIGQHVWPWHRVLTTEEVSP